MEDFIGFVIWGVFFIGAIVKFIGKFSSQGEGNKKQKDIEKKVADFFSGKSSQKEQRTTYSKEESHYNTKKTSPDDEWIPAYEEQPAADDRPLNKVSGDGSRSGLEKRELEKQLRNKRNSIEQTKLDDEITIRDGMTVGSERNKKKMSGGNKDKKSDAYHKTHKRVRSYLDENSFDGDDLIKGVIFKEILDEPRAKRPYRPFDRIR